MRPIVLDDQVLSASIIRPALTGGALEISGNLTSAITENLALLLRNDALPAKLNIVSAGDLDESGRGK